MPLKTDDRRKKKLFSDPVFFRQLLKTCIGEPWVQDIDFSSLEILPNEYIDKRLIASQNDMLYRIKFKSHPSLLIVILEFQSTPDRFMAIRVLHYLCSVYLSLIGKAKKRSSKKRLNKNNNFAQISTEKSSKHTNNSFSDESDSSDESDGPDASDASDASDGVDGASLPPPLERRQKLPLVLPLVLYNGESPWNAPLEFFKLVDFPWEDFEESCSKGDDSDEGKSVENRERLEALRPLKAYIPHFRYLCIDEARFDAQKVKEQSNLISALFLVERTGIDVIESVLGELANCIGNSLADPEERRAARLFLEVFFANLGINLESEAHDGEESQWDTIRTSLEVKTMLEKNVERWRNHERKIGEARGEARGKQEQKEATALKLLAKGMDPKEVAEIVELPEDEVRKLLH